MHPLRSLTGLGLLLLLSGAGLPAWGQPTPVIFDTDMGNDVDDALALAMIHALESRNEARLLAVAITKDNKWAAPFIDIVNTFYGRGDIPIGVVRQGKTPEDNPMIQAPAERKKPDGAPLYPHDLTDGAKALDAVDVLRRVLAAQDDTPVVIIQVGFSTNLAHLLDTSGDAHSPLPGKALIRQKVRLLSVMAGNFAYEQPEFNVYKDAAAAAKVFAEWPTPIVASGFEVGESILYPSRSIERDFSYVPNHPVAEAYRRYLAMPYDRPTWDLTSVLYALRPDDGYFTLSPSGAITVSADSLTHFTPSSSGNHRYLKADEIQKARALEAMIYLASQPPDKKSNP